MKYFRVAITGGAGFIGSEICRKLLASGTEILVYDNLFTGKESNLPSQANGLLLENGDINDTRHLENVLVDFRPNVVYHLAAIHYIPYCDTHPQETIKVNVEGTESVLQMCQKLPSLEKILLASSASVYKINDGANIEIDQPDPYDIYGYSKYFCERLGAKFYYQTSIPTLIARLFNTYGPYETNPHVIPRIIDQVRTGSNTITLGDVSPKRDFIFVEDVAEALIALVEGYDHSFDTFNIGTGREHSVEKVIDTIAKILKREIKINSADDLKRKVDRMHLLADVTKIKATIGWSARFSIEEGLQKTLDFYL